MNIKNDTTRRTNKREQAFNESMEQRIMTNLSTIGGMTSTDYLRVKSTLNSNQNAAYYRAIDRLKVKGLVVTKTLKWGSLVVTLVKHVIKDRDKKEVN